MWVSRKYADFCTYVTWINQWLNIFQLLCFALLSFSDSRKYALFMIRPRYDMQASHCHGNINQSSAENASSPLLPSFFCCGVDVSSDSVPYTLFILRLTFLLFFRRVPVSNEYLHSSKRQIRRRGWSSLQQDVTIIVRNQGCNHWARRGEGDREERVLCTVDSQESSSPTVRYSWYGTNVEQRIRNAVQFVVFFSSKHRVMTYVIRIATYGT